MAAGTRLGWEEMAGQATAVARPVTADRLAEAIERGVTHLLSLQAQEGYWLGELEADTTLESDYVFYLHVLGKADPERIAKLASYVRRRPLPVGGRELLIWGAP